MSNIKNIFSKIAKKNQYILCKDVVLAAQKNKVNINSWVNPYEKQNNFGDMLSAIIVHEVANLYGIDSNKSIKSTKHLYALGSLLLDFKDATIWGTGFNRNRFQIDKKYKLKCYLHKILNKTDIRAVRGPESKRILEKIGIKCPDVFGDPGLLISRFYKPNLTQIFDFLVVPHWSDYQEYKDKYPTISPITEDWRTVVDKICSARLIVCSSLHALIIAESYGVPAILLKTKTTDNRFKFNDYYYSTGRFEYPVAESIEDALQLEPILPNPEKIKQIQDKLIEVFPKDLWD